MGIYATIITTKKYISKYPTIIYKASSGAKMGLIPILPQNVEVILIIMAVIYTGISIAVQRLLSNPKKMREIQAKVSIMQKEMNAMLKSGAPQEQLAAKQKEFMPLLGEQMKNSMKPMLVILPLLFLTYYVIIPHIPIITSSNLGSSKTFFFIIVFSLGIVSAIIILLYDRQKSKQEMKLLEASSQANPNPQNNQ
jgi:uncharacterized membrane protein (DUF106 family)